MFPSDSRSIRNLNWIVEHIGPVGTLEVLLSFPATTSAGVVDRLETTRQVAENLQSMGTVHSVFSAASLLPNLSHSRGTRSVIARAVFRRKLETHYGRLIDQKLLARSGPQELWRITLRIRDMRGDNFAEIQDSVRFSVENSLRQVAREAGGQPPSFRISGLRTVIESAHTTLLRDLGGSFAAAFLLITPVMMLIVRGVLNGLVLMLPNLLPVVFVFGGMGWLGVRLDVASILTASVALGIAVDDTLHFMSWYLRSRRCGQNARSAVAIAIGACARPMIYTTVICSGAMLPFFFCDFLPTSKFALLMILILLGAILGDLILLPAILVNPLGSFIARGKNNG